MIQRIQTLYLLVVAVLCGLLFVFRLGNGLMDGGNLAPIMLWGYHADPSNASNTGVNLLSFGSAVLVAVTALLAVVTVFCYRNRRLQKRLCIIQFVLLLIAVIAQFFNLQSAYAAFLAVQLTVTVVFPVVAVLLILLAYRGVAKDDKLVRSLDRIR